MGSDAEKYTVIRVNKLIFSQSGANAKCIMSYTAYWYVHYPVIRTSSIFCSTSSDMGPLDYNLQFLIVRSDSFGFVSGQRHVKVLPVQ